MKRFPRTWRGPGFGAVVRLNAQSQRRRRDDARVGRARAHKPVDVAPKQQRLVRAFEVEAQRHHRAHHVRVARCALLADDKGLRQRLAVRARLESIMRVRRAP